MSLPRTPPPDRRRPRSQAAPARTARRVALECLVEVAAGGRANVVVPNALATSGLDSRDRGLVTELVYGSCRMQRACDWLVDRYVRGPTDPEVRAALRLGAYQLAWLRVPPHAAVSATVDEVRGPGRTLVNAVLRRVADQLGKGAPRWPDPPTELSYPDWIVARLASDLGPEPARAALEMMNTPAEMTVREDGYVQDRASQLVAELVEAGPGERVLDLCAAPGGKATAIAHGPRPGAGRGREVEIAGGGGEEDSGGPGAGGDSTAREGGHGAGGEGPGEEDPVGVGGGPALVVACDLSPSRAAVMAGNVARLGLDHVATVVADGTRPAWRPGTFDRVLVDAPCSGLGVLRRRPDARWRVQPRDLPRLAALQRRLLDAARRLVRPGGTLVYSVCTLSLVETGGMDRWLASEHPELVALPPPPAPWVAAGRGALLLPQAAGTDGMFLLRLRVPGG